MKKIIFTTQRGQALVLVALGIIAFLAMLALILDGGTTFAVRREMQNAADAGALAGARQLCITRDEGQAKFIARQYAEPPHNSAQSCEATASLDSRTVSVTATREINTFFAHFLGRDQIPVQASAEASCECPLGGPVLPIAWMCRPPLFPDESTSKDCEQRRLDETQLAERLIPPFHPADKPIWPELYIFMDSNAIPADVLDACNEPPTINGAPNPYYLDCDIDDDGEFDLIPNGGKAWLDLNGGGGGSSELAGWIRNGFNGSIWQHTWVGDQPGVANDVFQVSAEFEGTKVLVPVFTRICDGYPPTDCPSQWDGQDTVIDNSGGNYYYHIMGFAAFYITCVDAPGVGLNDHNPITQQSLISGSCPGHYYAKSINDKLNGGSFKSIEGYFVEFIPADFHGSTSTGCLDTGVYIINLSR